MNLFTFFFNSWPAALYCTGYKNAKIQKLTEDEPNPALCILLDWFQTSGNTALSVEMLLSYLEQMKRDDVIEVIEKGQGRSGPRFIKLVINNKLQ